MMSTRLHDDTLIRIVLCYTFVIKTILVMAMFFDIGAKARFYCFSRGVDSNRLCDDALTAQSAIGLSTCRAATLVAWHLRCKEVIVRYGVSHRKSRRRC